LRGTGFRHAGVTMTDLRKKLLILGTVACVFGAVQTASAAVQPAGTGEPLYTNSTQNTQWFEWPATSGADAYKVRYSFYENNALVADPIYDSPNGASNQWANWSGVKNLQHGGQYGICAQGAYSLQDDPLFVPDGPNSCSMGTMLGRRAYTTIDRSKPNASIAVAGGAAATNDAKIAVQVGFSDDIAGPFPANFMCFQYGGTSNICDSNAGFTYGYNSACSVPAGGGKATTFTCTADFGSGANPAPDGPVWACVVAADAAIPDNPNGPNQSASAEKANLSAAQCDSVLLDRIAPKLAIDGASTAKVGDLVSFGAQASDAASGVAGSYDWSFGDGTGGASGESVNHTFTQAGTYEVRVKTADGAGNQGSATKVITVSAPASGGGGGATGGGGSTGGGSTGGSNGGSSGGTNGGSTGGSGGSSDADDPSGDDDSQDAADLEVDAPRKVKAKAKALRLALTAGSAGKASFALVRSGRVIARGAKTVAEGTSAYKLKLPRKAKAGRYALKVTFKPAGGQATRQTLKVQLTGKAKAHGATAGLHAPRVSGAGAPSGLPNGVFHGVRKRSFVVHAE
jgi:plastocyanin